MEGRLSFTATWPADFYEILGIRSFSLEP